MNRMSRRCILVFAMALLLVLTATTALAATGKVTPSSLVLRKSMSTKSEALLTLRKGTELEVISKSGSWYKVKVDGKTGYVVARYVSVSGSVTSSSSSSAKDEYETLRKGDKGKEVRELQERLKELGYYNTTIDGDYGGNTKKAVEAFQKRNGLTVDGVAGKTTLTKLYSDSAKKANGSLVSSSSSSSSKDDADSGILRPGAKGSEVRKLQTRLRELGYFNHSVDGKYDSQVTEAVKAFQKKHGLTADGVAGLATQAKLYSSSAKKADGTTADNADDKEESSSTSLKPGASGSAVRTMQTRLRELGYFNHSVDGKYDSQVTEAVKAFQKKNGLTVDGIAGEKILNKLYSSSAKKANGSLSGSASNDKDDDDSLKLDAGKSMELGDRNDNVKALQQRLKDLGYFSGTCTGYYGTATREAVKDFQRRNSLSVDGLAGTATLRKLTSSSAKPAGSSNSSLNSSTGNSSSNEDDAALRPGDSGSAVRTLQTRLRALGYFNHSVDGRYDSQVTEAVKAFQERNGLTVDGIAGTKTLTKLNSSSAKPAAGSSSGGSLTGDKDDQDDEDDDTTLRPGSSGSKVKALQTRLRALGYFNHSVDGKYDSQVTEAVKAFQKRNGLTPDGVAGAATLSKLNSSSAKPAEDEDDSSSSSGSSSSDKDDDVTLRKGDSGTAVRTLQTRLRLLGYFDHSVDGKYDSQVVEAVKAFQKRNGLTADGVAGEATQKKLYSSSAKPATGSSSGDSSDKDDDASSGSSSGNTSGSYKTERLDWFNGGASKIPRKAIFTIKDVRTGKTFKAKRQGGTNHLDAEPLTAADTAIFKSISNFSWRRRPMLVLYNGHVYACSIYSEPHGDDTIPDNNYEGQFCLHFYGSKTHGTDRVDSDHAACEAQAMKATW